MIAAYYYSIFINKFEQIKYLLFRWVWTGKCLFTKNLMFDHQRHLILLYLFIVIASGEMVTNFIRYLFKYIWFFVFQIKMKNELRIWISIFSYFENWKTISSYVLCLNHSTGTKIKTLFIISYFNLSKKRNGTLGTRII